MTASVLDVAPFTSFDEALIWEARRWLFVREVGGPNRGVWVELFQQFTGGVRGDSWCADWLSFVLSKVCGGYTNSPLPRTGSCDVIYQHAKSEGWTRTTGGLGNVYVFVDGNDHAHHCGFDTTAAGLLVPSGIAGNTSADGSSDNGDRVAEHALRVAAPGRIVWIDYPRPAILAAA